MPVLPKDTLISYYNKMSGALGYQNWWPAKTPFEVIIGAILTQNTTWVNVEKSICALYEKELVCPHKLMELPENELALLIKSSGYFNQKAKKIKSFLNYFNGKYQSDINKMKMADTETLRRELLGVFGIGPETADSILLYALDKPVFVVDAYTRRIFSRHNMLNHDAPYELIRSFFEDNLPKEVKLYNEYHALIVNMCKIYCGKTPKCSICPLQEYL